MSIEFVRRPFPMGHLDGSLHLATVSGVATTKPELIRWFEKNVPDVEIITTKSFQVRPNPGNREPVICETSEGDFGNSVGLRNPGMEVELPLLTKLREEGLSAWLNISVSADNPDDFTTLVKGFDCLADSIELNFSCPHAKAGYGASIGVDAGIASEYVRRICEGYPQRKSLLFVKLTPNVEDIGSIAKAVVDAGADGITAINTVGPELHVDPSCGQPILQNALGGKGGKSGAWVYDRAIEAVREIRAAVGDEVPVIGMGGVSTATQCSEMIIAGADAVGIGSALAHVRQQDWPQFFRSMKDDSDVPRRSGRVMEYVPHVVTDKRLHCDDTLLLTLEDGNCTMSSFKAGEFVFLWIPGVGEKPFSVAMTSPLTFIIKKRGPFTKAVFNNLNIGDTIMLRGPYGAEVDIPASRKAIILAGGTGEAVAYPLAVKLWESGIPMSFLVGTSVDGNRGILASELSGFGSYTCVSDSGKPGRILDSLDDAIAAATSDGTDIRNIAFYLIGPEVFMKIASGKIKAHGVSPDMILLSMERSTMCGVGLCGECSCGGHLACQWGTFMKLSFLEEENVL